MGDEPEKAAAKKKAAPKKKDGKSKPRDIWSQVLEANKQAKRGLTDKGDTNVLVVGSKGAGKSTLVSRFLNPEDQDTAKPTMGLDYVFARRTSQGEKQVAHIWELGGGEDQASLMDAVITPENLRNFVCVVCVDLSKPSTVLESLVFWLDRVRKRIDSCLRVMSEKKSTVPDKLKAKSKESFGADHPDADLVNLCPCPILITGTKFDTFQSQDGEYRKIMGRTLRFLAHVNGASLYYASCRDKSQLTQYRSILNHAFFGGQQSAAAAKVVIDHSKALCVRAGTDQISGIGAPPRAESSSDAPVTPLDLYKHAFVSYFPPQQQDDDEKLDTGDTKGKFSEPSVDVIRAEKQELLSRYRAESSADKGR